MNLFLRVGPGEMKIAIELQQSLKGIYYVGRDMDELDAWLREDREIPIYIHFLQYTPNYPCKNVIISSPHPSSGDEYIFSSLNGVLQALIRNSRPFNLFFMKDEQISTEEYYLRVGDLMMCLVGEEDIICWVEVKDMEDLISLKIRGVQNFLISFPSIKSLKD